MQSTFPLSSLQNLDLLSVAVAIAAIGVLGFAVFFQDRQSTTGRYFFYLALTIIFWSAANYAAYQFQSPVVTLWLLRLVMFFAVWFAFSVFRFLYIFPEEAKQFPIWHVLIFIPLAIVTALIALTPLVLKEILELSSVAGASKIANGPGIILFGLTVLFFNIGGIISLLTRTLRSPKKGRARYIYILSGLFITLTLIVVFNFILPAFFDNPRFIPLGAVFIFPFVALTSYAILRHKLFNIKVVGTAVLVFALTVVTFLEIIYAGGNLSLILFRSGTFILVLIFGILLIKGVLREISLREQLQKANEGQANLIHIINHQIKGYLAKARNIFSELLTEPDYGPIPEPAKPMLDEGFKSLTEGVSFVTDFLSASNIEKGTYAYNMESIDLKALVHEVADEQMKIAEKKGLSFEISVADGDYKTKGDKTQLAQSIRNLIDNSVRYTPKGGLKINLSRTGDKILFVVKDTGVGISDELKPKLFTKGGRDKDSLKVNVNSTGFGLSFVKSVAEAHQGRVWAESDGQNKGSTFYMELPVT